MTGYEKEDISKTTEAEMHCKGKNIVIGSSFYDAQDVTFGLLSSLELMLIE